MTTNVVDKQKAILAKISIMNHPQCPEKSKLELAKELRILNNEIAQIKNNYNKKV